MTVVGLQLDREARGRVVHLDRHLEPFARDEALRPRLRFRRDMPKPVEEETAADGAIDTLLELGEDFKTVRFPLATGESQDLDRIRLARVQVQPAQVLRKVLAIGIQEAVLEEREEFIRFVAALQIRKGDERIESGLPLGLDGTSGIAEDEVMVFRVEATERIRRRSVWSWAGML